LGTFALYQREPASPDASQLELIAQFTNIASIAIERAQRDEALRQSEARRAEAERELQLTIDMIPAKVATYEPDGTRSFVNRQWRNYIEAAGDVRSIVRHFHPDDSERAKRAWRNSLATGQPLSVDMRIRRADGEYRWHTHHCVPLCDEQGTILKWYAAEVDIEDKKRAENALLRSEARIAEAERELRLTLDSIPTITWRAGAHGYVQQLNKRWFEYTGTTPQQVRGWRWKLCIHPDDLDRLVDTGNEYVATGKSIDGEARVRRHDGTYRWFLFRPAPVRDETGKVVGWYGAITDIEDRKRAEERAVEAERELQRTIDHIPVLVGTYAADGSRLFANKRGREFTGLSAGDVAGRRWKIAIHPDDLEREESKWRECIASGEPFELEYRMRASDGTYRWHMTRRVPLRDAAGKVIRWYGTGYDIEDRKRAEEALRRSETFLAEGQRISSTGTFSWRVDTDELTFSEELYRIFELDLGAAVTFERVFALVHPEDMRLLSERMKRIRVRDGSIEQEIRLLMPDGRVKYLRTIGQMADHQDGRPEYLGAIQDVTQRRLAEEALDKVRSELAHVTRVMSFSALTASIAHEVNQPLAGIVTNASTCLRMLAADPPNVEGARETARRTIRDGNRAADVISRLRALFSKRAATTEAVDLNEAAREILTLVSTDLLRSRISLRAELGSEPLLVTGDRVQLQQVILNLVRNALDAMSGVDDRPRSLLVKTYEEEDERARLTVKDVGAGFEPQGVERLFDVFYTTKSGGMGIGLSVSRSIIENHGGRLWAEANDGPGATFSFSIPRQAENARHDSIGEAAWTPNISAEHDVMRNA
jgi:PAS domain S-box-containing protein